VTQQKLRQAMTGAHQVLAGILDTAHQIPEPLIRLARHERERQLAGGKQPRQPRRVSPISLHPVTRSPRDRTRRDDPHIDAALRSCPRQSESRRARLIHSPHRPPQLLKKPEHHRRRRAPQPLHLELPGQRIKDRRDRLRLMHIQTHKSHTLRHGRYLP
jgi:hypothetical protein